MCHTSEVWHIFVVILPQVYLRIVAYVQALAEAAHKSIVAYDRRIEHHLLQLKVGGLKALSQVGG